MATFSIRIGPRVDGIREHMIDGEVARVDPADGAAEGNLLRKDRRSLRNQSQTRRAANSAKRVNTVRMAAQTDSSGFAILITPYKTDGETAA